MGNTTKRICPETNTKAPPPESCLERRQFRDNENCRKCPVPAKAIAANSASEVVVMTGEEAPETLKKIFENKTCKAEGCDKKLQSYNKLGYCGKHSCRAQKYKPTPVPCKTPGCENITKGTGKTGLCQRCANIEARKKCRTPAAKKKRRAIWAKNKKILETALAGGGSPQPPGADNHKPLSPALEGSPQKDHGSGPGPVIQLNFSEYPEVLEYPAKKAKLKKHLTNNDQ